MLSLTALQLIFSTSLQLKKALIIKSIPPLRSRVIHTVTVWIFVVFFTVKLPTMILSGGYKILDGGGVGRHEPPTFENGGQACKIGVIAVCIYCYVMIMGLGIKYNVDADYFIFAARILGNS